MKPDIQTHFIYRKRRIDVDWYDIRGEKLPDDINFMQVYFIGNFNGKIPIVTYPDDKHNLPGGGIEEGESVDEALRREAKEETNMRIVRWVPLGYQHCKESDIDLGYQLRVYADVEKIGEFVHDPGGSVTGNILIEPKELNATIRYGMVGERLMQLTEKFFNAKT